MQLVSTEERLVSTEERDMLSKDAVVVPFSNLEHYVEPPKLRDNDDGPPFFQSGKV